LLVATEHHVQGCPCCAQSDRGRLVAEQVLERIAGHGADAAEPAHDGADDPRPCFIDPGTESCVLKTAISGAFRQPRVIRRRRHADADRQGVDQRLVALLPAVSIASLCHGCANYMQCLG
jgi:hypothetical protein